MADQWYVLRTHAQQEERAARELANQDFRPFVPMAKLRVVRKGKVTIVEKPLFRSYIFVRMDVKRCRWQSVLSTRGITQFIGYREGQRYPLAIPRVEMKALRQAVKEFNIVAGAKPKKIEPGIMLKVLFGPFKDHEAKATKVSKTKVQILLQLLGKPVKLDLPRKDVVAV